MKQYLLAALAYVDFNPVRAGMVRHAAEYPFSSAAAHQSGRDPSGLLDMRVFAKLDRCGDWAELLAARESDEESIRAILESRRTGRPLSDEAFVKRIERELGVELERKPVGRPRKGRAKAAAGARRGDAETQVCPDFLLTYCAKHHAVFRDKIFLA